MHKRTPYCGYDNIPVWTDVDRSTLPSGTLSRTHTWEQPTLVLVKNKYRWKCVPTHTESKRPVVHLHTQTAPNV